MKIGAKKIGAAILGLVIICLTIFGVIALAEKNRNSATIVATNFPGYDFARAVVGNDQTNAQNITLLAKPGTELHDYDPTPEDIIRIKNADLFIYTGGESESWIEEILRDNEIPAEKTFKMMDFVSPKAEIEEDGTIGDEYDEHIWTSPVNAKKIVEALSSKLQSIYPDRAAALDLNAKTYAEKLARLDESFRQTVAAAPRKKLIFADRFPFRYFVDEYGLDYFAAFPGCAEETEASTKKIAELVDEVRESGLKTILKIELSSAKLAQAVAEETGAKILEFHSAHNLSQSDFEAGTTYLDLMQKNLEVLKQALNK